MPNPAPHPVRRSVLRVLSGALLVALSAAAAVPSLLYLLDPLRRRPRRAGGDLLPVAPLAEVPDISKGEAPLRAPVIAGEQHDAWTRHEATRLGSVWLLRGQGGDGGEVTCFSTQCPHAGCGVDFDEARRLFVCPCHSSTFALDGTRREGPAPRGLDRLEVDVKDGLVRCRFQRFRPASESKEPV
jgi:menaquinol-cytochrome c reductase iron-sulfur subunit